MRTLTSLLAASVALLPFAGRALADDTCTPARVMVVLDKSSSMQTGLVNNATKWSTAVDGLGQVLTAYEANAEFGLMTFPRPNQCAPGGLDVAPARNNRAAIMDALSTAPPESGNYTPMSQTLDVAAGEPSLTDATGAKHVIVITDGWQYCVPYDSSTRYDGVESVETLTAKGITTWVVGFGGEVDSAALNKMAVASGTARPGCDPTLTDPSAPNQCYFQVDSAAELITALTTIAGNISDVEVCDGIDNNCDGQIDENLTRECDSECGTGVETCSAGTWAGCTAREPASSETCGDDIDNDCNGQVDDANVCEPTNPETDDGGGAMQAGCGCESGGSPGGALVFALAGVAMFRRRARR